MSTQHTPGPWVARPDPNAISSDDWCVGIGDNLANIDKVAVCSKRDARLIAAAPELLKELQTLLAMCKRQTDFNDDGDGCTFDRCDAAIAKATGGEG
jgi:hypothetical protein